MPLLRYHASGVIQTIIGVLVVSALAFGLYSLIAWLDRRKSAPPPGEGRGAWEEIKITTGGLAHLGGCLLYLALGLVALFALVWIAKRMWEAV